MNLKVWAYLAIIVAVLGGLKWAHSTVYKSGWNAAIVGQEALIREAKDEAAEAARVKWQALVDAAEGQIIVEERIVEVIREVEKEIPVVVETVKLECRDLGTDVVGLLNNQVNSSSVSSSDSTGATPVPNP